MGIVRVSQVAGREGESFASPAEQRERIERACERDGLELVRLAEEIDVSGGTPLERRRGLRGAVESVEAGDADVVMVAYFDRLVRSLRVQDEVVSRVEAAGGRVVALDFGEVSGRTAAQWLSGTMIGAMSEYMRRSTKERAGAAQAMAVARGVLPFPGIPPGYVRGKGGTLTPSADAPTVIDAFTMRAEGVTIKEIRRFLRENGIERSYHGVSSMFASRIYLGEIHFGGLVNTEAHEPIIDRDLWERVQRVRVPRGRKPQSDRLLARLGVLRCGICGARMVVGTQTQGGRRYPFYRCPPTGDCPSRQTISAVIAEGVVVGSAREELRNVEGRASIEQDAANATVAADRAQADLDAAIRTFAGLDDEPVARERIAELRDIRDFTRVEAHRLSRLSNSFTINLAKHWDDLSLTGQREAIKLAIAEARVFPGKGAGRIRVKTYSQELAGD